MTILIKLTKAIKFTRFTATGGRTKHHTIIKSPKQQMKRNGLWWWKFSCFWQRQHHNHKKYQNFSHKIFINNYKLLFFLFVSAFNLCYFSPALTVYLTRKGKILRKIFFFATIQLNQFEKDLLGFFFCHTFLDIVCLDLKFYHYFSFLFTEA